MNPCRPPASLLLVLSLSLLSLDVEVDSKNKTVGVGVAVKVENRTILSIIVAFCEWRVEGVRMSNRWICFCGSLVC